jgi:hypothetical protein
MSWNDHKSKTVKATMVVLALSPASGMCAENEFCGRLFTYFPDEQTRPGPNPLDGKDRVLKMAIATASSTSIGYPTPVVTYKPTVEEHFGLKPAQ